MADDNDSNEEEGGGGGFDINVVKSYLAFVRRALAGRKLLVALILTVGVVLTGLVAKFLPRSYSCTTVMMTVENAVLDFDRGPRPLVGAKGMLMRRETLEQLVKDTDLVNKFPARRPPLLRLKDRMLETVFGKYDEKTMIAILVGTLEGRMAIDTKDDNLEITVEWNDPFTAAELTKAFQEAFLRIRHKAEISAFQEKMGILDTHATKLRQEIEGIADQLNTVTQDAQPTKAAPAAGERPVVRAPAPRAAPRAAVADSQLPELREKLAGLKQKLTAAEADRNGRMRDERAKLDELKLRFTPSHPQVITQDERLAMASQVSSELAMLRGDVADLESQIKSRDALAKTGLGVGGGGGGGAILAGADGEPLPTNVAQLLTQDQGDPALRAQLSGAVIRYGALRDDVRASKLALDQAQAAFNHRYQVVIPVEVPMKPFKPNLLAVIGAGVVLSLLLALLVPIVSELRRGVLVEYWQVHDFRLPVLADLRLPPSSNETPPS